MTDREILLEKIASQENKRRQQAADLSGKALWAREIEAIAAVGRAEERWGAAYAAWNAADGVQQAELAARLADADAEVIRAREEQQAASAASLSSTVISRSVTQALARWDAGFCVYAGKSNAYPEETWICVRI